MGDRFTLISATRPADLRHLLQCAKGARSVVELGTATAWTAITLALADPIRRVVTYDVVDRVERSRYLSLVGPAVRARIDLVLAPGSAGPAEPGPVDVLYIDSSHDRDETIEEVRAWQPHLGPGARVIFDDYASPDCPGVREAIEVLGLPGEQRGRLFIHRHAAH